MCVCSVWPGLAFAGQKFGAGVGNGIGEMLSLCCMCPVEALCC